MVSGQLLLIGDFNFHIDQPTDTDANRFLQLLDTFDQMQHVAGATHRNGHTLVISRGTKKDIASNCSAGESVSDHSAVH